MAKKVTDDTERREKSRREMPKFQGKVNGRIMTP